MAFATDLYRKRALLLHADRSAQEATEAGLQRALVIARQQSALSFELRAARDRAHLEGFHTPDLQESKALLAELTN